MRLNYHLGQRKYLRLNNPESEAVPRTGTEKNITKIHRVSLVPSVLQPYEFFQNWR